MTPREKFRGNLLERFGVGSRARLLVVGISAGLVGRMAALVAPLLATPILYSYFGDLNFGLWATAVSITSIATSLDLGIGSGLLTRAATAHGRADSLSMRRYIASAYGMLGVVSSTLILVSVVLFSIYSMMGDKTYSDSASLCFAVIVTFLVSLPAALIHQILYAVQRIALSSILLVTGAFGGLAACVVAVQLESPIWVVAAAYSAPTTLVALAGAAYYFGRNRLMRPRLSDFDWSHARDLLKLGSHFLVLSVLMAVGLNVDNLIIAFRAGAEAVAAYSIPARLGSVLGLIIMNLFMPLWAANSEAIAKGDYLWVERGTRRMSLLGVAIVIASGLFLIMASDQIMNLWVGRTFEDQHLTLGFVIAGSAVVAATSPYNMLLNSLGRADLQIIPWAAFAVLSIIAKLILITADRIWMAAALTGLCYLVAITPAIMVRARRALARSAEDGRNAGPVL